MNTQPLPNPAEAAGIEATELLPDFASKYQADGLVTSEYVPHDRADRILKGNADIAVSERGTARPDTRSCTLPIYPLQRDLPQLRRTGGAA